MSEEEYIDVIIENIFATEHQKEYKREYYKQHRDRYNQQRLKWCRNNPNSAKAITDRWFATRPHYQRDYQRKRKAAAEPLIFEFVDCFGGDMGGFITYLRNRGVSEQHVNWFKVDVRKYLPEVKE